MNDISKEIKEFMRTFQKETKRIKGINPTWIEQPIKDTIELLKGGD